MSYEILPGLEDAYDHIEKIAIGGMAEVYRGRQIHLDRPVAIKRIKENLKDNKDMQERFRREAMASAVLLHQNLAHVYDYVQTANDSYIVMEYIDGFDLGEILEKSGALPIDVALIIAIKILSGLSHVHAHALIHRDIKPDNIRISTRGDVKIMDFGIAVDLSESSLTMPGILVGSPHYLSPEQITGAKLDSRVDLFSFGIVFYQILTGKRPFFETQKESVYQRIHKGEYIEPQNIREEIPSLLVQIIQSCLQTQPSKRPNSAAQLSQNLMEYMARHYSLSFENRIKQFLMQTSMLSGNPELLEVDEKTNPGLMQPKPWFQKTWALVLWSLLLVSLLLWSLYKTGLLKIQT